jgi:luciferase family oxidoreductase group 1
VNSANQLLRYLMLKLSAYGTPHLLNRPHHPTNVSLAALSVLDLVPLRPEDTPGAAIRRSVEAAQHVEKLGYKRYWLAEHHSIAGLACSATALLIGHIANATKTIRVGSGGIMLPNHAPLIVAEQFGTLESLFPGRIDLGLGRAPGSDAATMRALRRDLRSTGDDFPELVEELRTYLGPPVPGQRVFAIPGQNTHVPIVLLGSSDFSAQLAGELGLPFAFAAHFAPDYLLPALQLYRQTFHRNHPGSEPYAMAGLPIIVAPTDAEAQYLLTPTAALPRAHPQSSGRAAPACRFHARPLDPVGATRSRRPPAASHRGQSGNSRKKVGRLYRVDRRS